MKSLSDYIIEAHGSSEELKLKQYAISTQKVINKGDSFFISLNDYPNQFSDDKNLRYFLDTVCPQNIRSKYKQVKSIVVYLDKIDKASLQDLVKEIKNKDTFYIIGFVDKTGKADDSAYNTLMPIVLDNEFYDEKFDNIACGLFCPDFSKLSKPLQNRLTVVKAN